MRIPTFLTEHHVPFETIVHPPAFTAQKRAKYLHVPGARVAKCVLLQGPAGYLLAVLPATRHVDTERLAEMLGRPVRLAEEREVADVFRDCEWGVAAPFGQLYGVPTVLDESLAPEDLIVVEANSHMEAVRLRVRDFIELEQPRRLAFAR
jgi:Ala-tRNA(Pro) deacylase